MIIKNAEVFTPEQGFVKKNLYIDKGILVAEQDYQGAPDDCLDAAGLKAIPELIDLHFHGCAGADFSDGTEEAIQTIADYELKNGIGAICPATMTCSEADIAKIAAAARAHHNGAGADLVGINMEGPFLNYKKRGAHNAKWLHKPDAEMFLRLQEQAGGLFKLCSLAPEEPGALEFIEQVKEQVKVAVAHTSSDYETATRAFQAGACHVTHLFNGMTGFTHREPGPIGAAWEQGVTVELIADSIHVHPAAVKMTFSLFGKDRVVMISDSIRAAGLPEGTYDLGGQSFTVKERKAVLTDAPETIAGSVTNLMDCLRNVVKNMDIPLETAVQAAAVNPAKVLGIEKQYGTLEDKRFANVLLVDADLNIAVQIHHGKVIS